MFALQACAGDTTQLKNKATLLGDGTGLKLPDGFNATVVAENLGRARHIVVNSNGDIYVSKSRGLETIPVRGSPSRMVICMLLQTAEFSDTN